MNMLFGFEIPDAGWVFIGIIMIILSLSFMYKGWQGAILGRCWYWAGFLPFTLVSPWFIHIPPKDPAKTLIKRKEGLLCHILIGPLMFCTAVPLLIVGCDLAGLPGTDTANLILSGGDSSKPSSIVYTPRLSYRLPIMARIGQQLWKIVASQVSEDKDRTLLHKKYGPPVSVKNRMH